MVTRNSKSHLISCVTHEQQTLEASVFDKKSKLDTMNSSEHGRIVYRSALQFFLHKQFKEALQTLTKVIDQTGLSATTRNKSWSLYFALVDAVFRLDGNKANEELGRKVISRLLEYLGSKEIWTSLMKSYAPDPVNLDVASSLILLQLRYVSNPSFTQEVCEGFLADSALTRTNEDDEAHTKLLELYVLHVLPHMEEWDYAEEFLQFNSLLTEDKKSNYRRLLSHLRQKSIEDRQGRLQISEFDAQDSPSNEVGLDPLNGTIPMKAVTSDTLLPSTEKRTVEPNKNIPLALPWPSWLAFLSQYFGRREAFRNIALMLLFLMLTVSRRARDGVLSSTRKVVKRIATTIGMALQVSYI